MSRDIEVYSYKGHRLPIWAKLLLILALAGVLTFGALLGIVLHGAYDHVEGDPQIMVILGCKVEPWGPSTLLQNRLDKALDYLEEHPDVKVVVSGGQGPDEPNTEAAVMAEYLMNHGISEQNIYLEDQSHSTQQNLQLTRQLLIQQELDTEDGVLIVSNGFHLTRARMLAERNGFGAVSTLSAPSSHIASRIKMYIREPLALVKSFLLDR